MTRGPALLGLVVALPILAPSGPALAVSDGVAGGSSIALHVMASGSTLSNVTQGGATEVAVAGTVGGRGLTRWTLDAGPGEAPSSWTRIAEGAAPVAGHSLGVWRTGTLANGPYVLRLQAWDVAGRGRETRVPVTLASFSLRQDRLELNATGGGVVTYTSVVPFPLTEALVIKDRTGRVVRTLVDAPRPAGTYADAWDGRDDAGAHLPDGPYFVVATVSDGTHTMTWDQSHEFLDNYFDSKDALRIEPFDPFDNRPLTVAYTSPAAGIVTISVFNKSLTTLDCDQPPEKVLCLVKGAYEEAGAHTFVWAGVDAEGRYRGDAYTLLSITCTRSAFARNAVVLYGIRPVVRGVRIDPPSLHAGGIAQVSFEFSTFDDGPADVTVTFLNQASLSTLRTITRAGQTPGRVSLSWDGRADNGASVAPGTYTVTVTASDRIGNRVQGQILATVRR
jgi:flagellar hook assembly protein FlgD